MVGYEVSFVIVVCWFPALAAFVVRCDYSQFGGGGGTLSGAVVFCTFPIKKHELVRVKSPVQRTNHFQLCQKRMFVYEQQPDDDVGLRLFWYTIFANRDKPIIGAKVSRL